MQHPDTVPHGPTSRRWMACLVLTLTLAAAQGCHSFPGTPRRDPLSEIGDVTFEVPVRWYHSLAFWMKPLPKAVRVRKISETVLDTGRLQVCLEVRNDTPREVRIDYQARFYDENGMRLEEAPWRLLMLPGRIEKQIIFNSVSAKARRFRIHIRRAR